MNDWPSGTVTFLFTDIEGSTRLWEEDPAEMRGRIADHDDIVRTVVDRHGGVVFSSQGDSFAAAFHTCSAALSAAVEAQLALRNVLEVRMAIHVGPVDTRDGDYFGPTLNRCGRLRDAAHGRQIVCSQAVVDLLPEPPAGVELMDLGEHRLRDLGSPEHIHQIIHPDLESEFPPLRTLQAQSTNLPIQVTSFVGRDQEMAELDKLLNASRLVTMVCPGGCGKSRLAIEIAAGMLDEYPDGVWLVELASVDSPDLVVSAIASVLGVRERPDTTRVEALVAHVKNRRLLLVLDNCEHILDPLTSVVCELISRTPEVRVLATSREPLHAPGEAVYPVRPLPLPEHGDTAGSIAHSDAVRLFIERAAAVCPGFHLNVGNAQTVASICRHLDGIPLAIELAAAITRVMPVDQIEARLDDRFLLLRGASRDRLPHHRTLEAAIDWSFGHLTLVQQDLLARLPVFAGGWTLEAAECVCAGGEIDRSDVLPLLSDLVDRSLVNVSTDGPILRYRFLETVHAYVERLGQTNHAALADRHAAYYMEYVRQISEVLETDRQPEAVRLLASEQANVRAALDYLATTGRGLDFCMLLDSAWYFLWLRRFYGELDRYLEHAVEVVRSLPDAGLRGRILLAAGWTRTRALGLDLHVALPLLRESVVSLREADDDLNLSRALCYIAINEDPALFEEALEAAVRSEESSALSRCHHYMGISAFLRYDFEAAVRHFDVAMKHWSSANHRAFATTWKAAALFRLGQVNQASVLARDALAAFEENGDLGGITTTLETLTEVELHLGNYCDALRCARRRIDLEAATFGREDGGTHATAAHAAIRLGDESAALGHLRAIRTAARNGLMDTDNQTHGFVAVALLALKRGEPDLAASALAAESVHRAVDGSFPTRPRHDDIARLGDDIRKAMGPDEFGAAWQRGTVLTLDDLVDLVSEYSGSQGITPGTISD